MIFTLNNNHYLLLYNYKEAFNLDTFKEKYIPELFNSAKYILGDISDKNLRLKGFKEPNFKQFLHSYLVNSCSFDAPYFLLKKVKSTEEDKEPFVPSEIYNYKLEKVNFNFDDLILTSNPAKPKKLKFNLSNYDRLNFGEVRPEILKIISEDRGKVVVKKKRGNYARFK